MSAPDGGIGRRAGLNQTVLGRPGLYQNRFERIFVLYHEFLIIKSLLFLFALFSKIILLITSHHFKMGRNGLLFHFQLLMVSL
jgi:hypothetical protein